MHHVVEEINGIVQHHGHTVGAVTEPQRIVEHAQRLNQGATRREGADDLRRLFRTRRGTGPLNAKPRGGATGHGDHPPLIERTRGLDVVLRKMGANEAHLAQ